MAESLFDIFGEHRTKPTVKNISRHPMSNIENLGKFISSGPIKPNEPTKKVGDVKKSFLSNTGKTLQSTPLRKAFTPRAVNVGPLIFNDDTNTKEKGFSIEELEFTKPSYKCDNYHRDLLDYLPMPEPQIKHMSPPNTPPPAISRHSIEFDYSYQDEFFTDDFSNESIPDYELGLPDIY